MAGRRGMREGSIYREKSGLWAASFYADTPDGRRVRKVMRAKDREVVAKKLTLAMADAAKGQTALDQTMTLGSWLKWWLSDVVPGTCSAESLRAYTQRAGWAIHDPIARVKLAKLDASHVQAWMRRLELRGLSPRSRSLGKSALGKALRDAMRFGYAHRDAAALVRHPQAPKTKLGDSLTAEQAEAVLRAARGDRLEALAILLLSLGMRQGECLDLRWDALNLRSGTLNIPDAKTDSGMRTLELPSYLVDALKAHQLRQKAERLAAPFWVDASLVFPNLMGARYHRRTALDWWYSLTIGAGVGRRRMHATRHTCATLMLARGVKLEVISKLLGHSSYAITANIYAKVQPQAMRAAAESLADIFASA